MRIRNIVAGSVFLGLTLFAQQAPPDQQGQGAPVDEQGPAVARLSILNGEASVRRGDSGDWVAAAVNAPLMSGDSLSVSAGGRGELQFDYANFLRVAGDTEVRLSDIENNKRAIQFSRGVVTWRTLRDTSGAAMDIELETQTAAVRPGAQSVVRMEVAPDGATKVTVRRGDAEVSTSRGGMQRIHDGQEAIVHPAGDVQILAAGPRDEWDNWSDQRDTYLSRSESPRYVTQDVYGVEDLDHYGQWVWDPAYGWVWAPAVASTWAPYHDGRWAWEDYYGWTWVDASPWGWAPFHYGSWYQRAGGWAWYPGARTGRTWWRPAMVGFFGLGNVGVGFEFGNIGWVPLAPYEVYHPWYGRGWFNGGRNFGSNINIIHNTNIVNVYRNARGGNGVSVIGRNDFERGNFRNTGRADQGQLQRASMMRGAVPVTPGNDNLRFSDRNGSGRGPRNDFANQRFVSRSPQGQLPQQQAQRGQRTPFAQQQESVRSAFGGGRSGGNANFQQGGGRSIPQQAPAVAQPNPQNAPQGFQRFGRGQEPSVPRNDIQRPQPAAPNQTPRGDVDRGGETRSWRNFGSPRNEAAPAAQQQRVYPQQQQRQQPSPAMQQAPAQRLQVAPPIMRQREQQQAPRQSPQQSRGFGAPPVQQQAPRVRQQPAPQPQMRQQAQPVQRQAPQQTQPQTHQSNGGGDHRGNRGR